MCKYFLLARLPSLYCSINNYEDMNTEEEQCGSWPSPPLLERRPASSTEAPTPTPAPAPSSLSAPPTSAQVGITRPFLQLHKLIGRKLNNLSGLILLVWRGTWLPAKLFACGASLSPFKVSKPPWVTYWGWPSTFCDCPSRIFTLLFPRTSSHLFQNGYFFLVIAQRWL